MLEASKFLDIVRNAPLISIDLIVRNHNNDVLLGLRKSGPARNTWFVPGGRIFKDERTHEAFSRITKGELGVIIDISSARFLNVYEHLYHDNVAGDPSFGTHYIVLAYEVKLLTEYSELPLKQHSEYRWMSERDILQKEEVHPYTKDYFRQSHSIDTSSLLSLYNIYQTAISYYTNIIWAFPAAFLALNFVAWGQIKETPWLDLIIAILNFLFLQAFCKLIRNQRAIVKVLTNTEKALSERFDHPPHSILLPKFEEEYSWFTKFRSADLFRRGLVVFTVGYFAYAIWKCFLA